MASRSYPSLYDVLNVEKSASTDEIRKAYRKKALETHPDKLDPNATDEDKQAAEHQFHKIHEAFEVLGDLQKRRTYDARLAMRADPHHLSQETARRMADRFQWALQQREQHLKRMEELKKEVQAKKAPEQVSYQPSIPMQKVSKEAELVEEMVRELYEMNPEIASRRQAALQRKAERERAELKAELKAELRKSRKLPA